ncbi:hypothetical protein LCGC14_1252640 [marine sediment metagenome]|uniref:Uncharacterized protein n=1 Tax=marine sediment metagenome TaxID=412755 RepID=A0A0F9L2Q9_9ZZZZ
MRKLILFTFSALFLLVASFSHAADVTPSWGTMQDLFTGTSVIQTGHAGGKIGTIDVSGNFIVEISVNWEESGGNPSGTAGVSFYLSGTSDTIPTSFEITATNYTDNDYPGSDDTSSVTQVAVFQDVFEVTVEVGKDALDQDTFNVRYRLMAVQSN